MENLALTADHVKEAYQAIKDTIVKTPLLKSEHYSDLTNSNVYLKMENLQQTGSFKFRGAFYKVSTLTDAQKQAGIIACSSGNHAQGVALSACLQAIDSLIVMPTVAPATKVEATKNYKSQVILHGDIFDESKDECFRIQKETNRTFLHPYDDLQVMAGQGTVALEMLEQLNDIDCIVVPVGGGGLIAGVAVYAKSINPNIKIIGVQADNVHGMKASFDKKEITSHFECATLADGCAVKVPGDLTFEVALKLVDEIVCVSEQEISDAIKGLLKNNKIAVEGAGALSIAALQSNKINDLIKGKNTVAILSGGNIDLNKLSNICTNK